VLISHLGIPSILIDQASLVARPRLTPRRSGSITAVAKTTFSISRRRQDGDANESSDSGSAQPFDCVQYDRVSSDIQYGFVGPACKTAL